LTGTSFGCRRWAIFHGLSALHCLFTANRVAFPSSPGVACLFPSQLRHGCDVPSRGEERISLAFNVLLAGVGRLHRLQAAVGLKPLVQQSIRRF
jgi:hypothetical protein